MLRGAEDRASGGQESAAHPRAGRTSVHRGFRFTLFAIFERGTRSQVATGYFYEGQHGQEHMRRLDSRARSSPFIPPQSNYVEFFLEAFLKPVMEVAQGPNIRRRETGPSVLKSRSAGFGQGSQHGI